MTRVWGLAWLLAVLVGAAPGRGQTGVQQTPREALIAEAERACRKERWEEAVARYREAFALGPGPAGEFARVGELLLRCGRAGEAVEWLREGRRLHPEEGELGIQLGLCLHEAGRFQQSFTLLQQLEGEFRAASPGLLDDTFYFYLGSAAERAGRVDEAIGHFRKAIDLALGGATPERAARPANSLGYLLLEQNRELEEALGLIKNANEWAPETPAYVDSLGWAQFKLGRLPEALRELLRAERLLEEERGRDPAMLDHIAQGYFALGHRDLALQYLRRAIEQAPEDKGYRARLEQFQTAQTVAPVPLDFLKDPGGPGDKGRRRRR